MTKPYVPNPSGMQRTEPRTAMDPDRFRFPSLNALKAFHAAARHGSIHGAAGELSVTRQAIGQHIKLLEETLQVTLFERRGRSIESTEAATLLARYVEAGFDELSEGVRRVSVRNCRDRINLNVAPWFATRDPRPAACCPGCPGFRICSRSPTCA